MTSGQAVTALRTLGWDAATTAQTQLDLRSFQSGYNLGPALTVDGRLGPLTSQALMVSVNRHDQGRPTASASFSFSDFTCPCKGTCGQCRKILALRSLIAKLETLSAAFYGRSLRLVDVYRCPQHNGEVGGAAGSQHQFGAAADVPARVGLGAVRSMRLFAGIGYNRTGNLVSHVDVRDDPAAHRSTSGTPQNPTTWEYPR